MSIIINSRLFLNITGLWLSLGLAIPAIADPHTIRSHVKAQAVLELPSLNQSFKGARAETTGKRLRVSTGKIQRSWELTERGLRTVSLKDLRGDKECVDTQAKYHCDWQFPGIEGNARLLSLTASESNDQGFTSDHLKVVATFEYEADNLLLQYVIWAYPESEGLRTQCRVKLIRESPANTSHDTEGEGVTDSLPINLQNRRMDSIAYYAGTQNRNTKEQEILRHEIQADCPQKGQVDWASIVAVRGKLSGVVMLKESHKCANTPEMGANTGRFTWDSQGLRNTGTGWHVNDLSADRYRDCWATWMALYKGGDDEMALALKVYDRLRYPVDPARDIYVLANTWGTGEGMRASRIQAREDNILAEIDSQADLGIDIQQIDDGWQGHDFKNWRPIKDFELKPDDAIYPQYKSDRYPVYPNGWDKVRKYAKQKGVKLGLWAHVAITEEDLTWNYDHGDFRYYKLDYAHLPTMGEVEDLMQRSRKLILHSDHKVRINWDVTERNPRVGYFYGREYGNIYLANRKPKWPKNVVYKPYLVLRDAWQLAGYTNLNKFQITIQNAELTRTDISDAYLHGHDYLLTQTLMGSPIFFQETRYYNKAARDILRPLLSLYKQHRHAMFEGYVFPIGDKPDNESWSGFQNHDPNSRTGYLTLFRQLNNKQTQASIGLKFLAGKTIQISNLQTQASRTVKVPTDGKVNFTITNAPGYLFLKYTLTD
jgi:hypothetical protein